MTGKLITYPQVFTSNLGGPNLSAFGDPITSDSFNRGGAPGTNLALMSSMTNVYKGGTPKQWGGTNAANIITQDDQLRIGANAVSSLCVDAGKPDMMVSFRMVQGPASPAGLNSIFDLRKASAATGDCYRLAFYSAANNTFIMRPYRRVSGAGVIMGDEKVVNNGSQIKVNLKGSSFKIYVDDVLMYDLTDTNVPAGNFTGFATSSNNQLWIVSEFVVRDAV